MTKKDAKIKTGWEISVSVKDKFTDWCAENGQVIQTAVAGALTVWPCLPPRIRQLALMEAQGVIDPQTEFWAEFERGLEVGIHAQLLHQQEKPSKRRGGKKKG